LEGIADEDIVKNADENDIDKDGISGKANMVWNVLLNKMSIGKFGWKAGQPEYHSAIWQGPIMKIWV